MATSNLRFRIIGEDDASGAFLKAAASAKLLNSTFSDLGTNALGLTKLVGGAGLIPVLAGATAAVTELGTSMAAGALAGGVFGLSVAGIGSDMIKQQKAITTLDKKLSGLSKGTDAYKQTLSQLHVAQANFNADFGPAAKGLDRMKESWAGFKDATRDVTTGVMAKGFDLISSVLPKLVPVSNAAGRAIGGLIDDLSNWTKSPGFNAVIKWLKTSGPAAITHFGHAVGNTISGLGGIFANFVGPGDKAAATLERLTKRFADWGHSKGVSDSVNKFLNYISANGPNITASLSALAAAAPKVAAALGQLGAANLNVVTKSLTLIAALPQGAFDIVVNGLFGIAVAAKAVNIAMGIGALIQGVTLAMTALGDAAIGTRIGLALLAVQEKVVAAATVVMTAAQWALNVALDANPIGLVVIAIAALVAGLIIAYKHSETFRNIVNGAFHAVAAAAAAAFNWIRAHWPLLISILGGPVGLATVLIIKNFDKIQGAIKVVGKWATWLWNNAFQPALSFIVKGIAFLLDVWGHMLSALGHVPGFGWAKDAGAALQNAADRARNLADNIGKIPTHKESTVVLNVVHNVVHTTGGHVPKFAKGVQNFGGGLAMVGEEGPELVTLPRGASVYPHGTGPGGVTVVVNAGGLVDPRSMAALIHKELLKLRRRDLGGAGLGLG